MTDQELAALFKVGEAAVRRWKRLRRETRMHARATLSRGARTAPLSAAASPG
jgi:hypothetical protein